MTNPYPDDTADTLAEYTIAPQHSTDLAEVDPYIFQGVAYSPLKCAFLSPGRDEGLFVVCDSCEWYCTVGDLPEDTGYVQPDLCPACAERGELGFIRSQSPADGTLPSGWGVPDDA